MEASVPKLNIFFHALIFWEVFCSFSIVRSLKKQAKGLDVWEHWTCITLYVSDSLLIS